MHPRTPQELERVVDVYIADVLEGRRVVGRFERLAVERHIRDLGSGAPRGLRFNAARARRAMWWVERRCRFPEGEWAGRVFTLEPWQAFVIACLFGWERFSDGRWVRRFRTGYISMARKNAKSTLAAAIALLMLNTGGAAMNTSSKKRQWLPEPGAQVYSAATTKDQSALVWRLGEKIVRRSPQLRQENVLHPSRYNMTHPRSDGFFRALAADADTLDGLGPYCAIVDELHAHPDGTVWDVLGTGMGARREPLLLAITTAGKDQDSVCGEVESDAIKMLEQVYEADTLFAFICRLDEGDDPFDEKVWPKSNPNYGVSVIPDGLRIDADKASKNPGRLNEFLRKRMNMWTAGDTAWMSLQQWDECAGDKPIDPTELEGRPLHIGVDLSATRDTTSVVGVWTLEDGTFATFPWIFVPFDTIDDTQIRGPRERELMHRWIDSGHVIATPGDMVDQEAIWLVLLNLIERHRVQEIAFDRWLASGLLTKCQQILAEEQIVGFGQGYKDMAPAMQTGEIVVGRHRLVHGGNPVLRWMISNTAVKRDPSGNQKPDKSKPRRRIDGVVGWLMAQQRASLAIPDSGQFVHTRPDPEQQSESAS